MLSLNGAPSSDRCEDQGEVAHNISTEQPLNVGESLSSHATRVRDQGVTTLQTEDPIFVAMEGSMQVEERCVGVAVFKPVRSRVLASNHSLKRCKPEVGLLEGFAEIRCVGGERPDVLCFLQPVDDLMSHGKMQEDAASRTVTPR